MQFYWQLLNLTFQRQNVGSCFLKNFQELMGNKKSNLWNLAQSRNTLDAILFQLGCSLKIPVCAYYAFVLIYMQLVTTSWATYSEHIPFHQTCNIYVNWILFSRLFVAYLLRCSDAVEIATVGCVPLQMSSILIMMMASQRIFNDKNDSSENGIWQIK